MDSVSEELERLANLRAKGDLTEEEYEQLKNNLINEVNSSTPYKSKRKKTSAIIAVLSVLTVGGIILGLSLSKSDSSNDEEEAWIEMQLEDFDELGIPAISRENARCAIEGFIDQVSFEVAEVEFGRDEPKPETFQAFLTSLFKCSDTEKILLNDFFNDGFMEGAPPELIDCSVEVLSENNSTLLIDFLMQGMTSQIPDEETTRAFFSEIEECIDIGELMLTAFLQDEELESLPPEFLECMVQLLEKDSKLVVDLMMLGFSGEDSVENIESLMGPLIPNMFVCIGESLSDDSIENLFQ